MIRHLATQFRPGDRIRLSARGLKQFRNNSRGVKPAERRGTVMAVGPSGRPRVWWDHLEPQTAFPAVVPMYLEICGVNLEDLRAGRKQWPLFQEACA
jgi:hypothetical protein